MKARKSAKTKVSAAIPDATVVETPDAVRETAEVIDTPADTSGFPIVGVGASAGGLAAFEAFFSGMPTETDTGMAFVLVQHLAPDHKSLLTDLIRRYTRMQVFEVEDGMAVQPNCVYIIAPGRDMGLLDGTLQLLEPSAPHGRRMPIDFFFRSLARSQGERAIGIVLSGTGSDGTLGVQAIKAEGGLAMAQTLDSTEFDGMPRSAMDTGLVDYQLPPAEMPAQLIAHAAQTFDKALKPNPLAVSQIETSLEEIFLLLRNQTGHDFSQYKPNTIHRRIKRRMAAHQVKTIDGYLKYLQQKPLEVEALLHDLLIGVTSFFRDPEAFRKLEDEVIPKLFEGKPAGAPVRIWSIGCSTGEEAYSLAILLQERMAVLKQSYNVQIFASDIDRQAIATARAGLYPAAIADSLSPERLARFFTMEHGGSSYRIHKSIRDMLVFSEHNAIKDPPFSRLDLIICRNILIYMGRDLQKKLIPLCHYALNPNGFLFLGSSETVGEFHDLFTTLDRKLKLYQRKGDFHTPRHVAWGRFSPPLTATNKTAAIVAGKKGNTGKLTLRELTERLFLQKLAPTGALVNAQGDILYLHGRTGMYLEPATGEVGVYNIIEMAREGLRHDLTTALRQAAVTKETVSCVGLRIETNGDFATVNLTVHPVVAGPTASQAPLYLVILEEVALGAPGQAASAARGEESPELPPPLGASVRIAALRQELRAKEEYLQAANEELETSNEEMQSINEELQSTNEELETSKEELQSINEELATVNTELQTKVTDLSRANNDMNNLLAGTGIATVFVDRALRILRFTPTATAIINLIQSDVGRPVGHTVTNIVGYTSLVTDVQAVLNSLIPREIDVQTIEGKWYTMRIQPYRTIDDVIEGAVITFVDITQMKNMQEILRKANALSRLAVVVRDTGDAMAVQDLEGNILAWNPASERMYGWSEAEALTMNIRDFIPEGLQEESLAKIEQLSRAGTLKSYRTQRLAKDGTIMDVWMTSSALVNEAGQLYAIATTGRTKGGRIDRKKGPRKGRQE